MSTPAFATDAYDATQHSARAPGGRYLAAFNRLKAQLVCLAGILGLCVAFAGTAAAQQPAQALTDLQTALAAGTNDLAAVEAAIEAEIPLADIVAALQREGRTIDTVTTLLVAAGTTPAQIASALAANSVSPQAIAGTLATAAEQPADVIASALQSTGASVADISSALSASGFNTTQVMTAVNTLSAGTNSTAGTAGATGTGSQNGASAPAQGGGQIVSSSDNTEICLLLSCASSS